MKIIDLLNKIAKGEEIPKKIKVNNMFVYEYDKDIDYKSKDGTYLFDSYIQIKKEDMNMEVEIIEEDNKDNFTGWKMYQDGKEVCSIDYSTNEEHKIPEKLDKYVDVSGDLACDWSFAEKKLKNKINEIIDYLGKLK